MAGIDEKKNGIVTRYNPPEEFELDAALEPIKNKYYDDNFDIKQEVLNIIVKACGSQLQQLGTGPGLVVLIDVKPLTAIETIYQQIESNLLKKLNIKAERKEFEISISEGRYSFA